MDDQLTAEKRSFALRRPEIREAEGDGPARIEGLAVPYGTWTRIGNWFEEMIEPGAFREYLAGDGEVIYNYGHDRRNIMGKRSSGTLRVEEREDGVYVSLDIPNITLGRDMREMIARGDITGHSIEFYTVEDAWEYASEDDPSAIDRRRVIRGELPGVALVADPAYADTTAALRSRDQAKRDALAEEADRVIDGLTDGGEAARARLRLAEAQARASGLTVPGAPEGGD